MDKEFRRLRNVSGSQGQVEQIQRLGIARLPLQVVATTVPSQLSESKVGVALHISVVLKEEKVSGEATCTIVGADTPMEILNISE
jgi:hypothetical protein